MPEELVVALVITPRAFRTVTFAPTTRLPSWSVTVPLSAPVVLCWASRSEAIHTILRSIGYSLRSGGQRTNLRRYRGFIHVSEPGNQKVALHLHVNARAGLQS